MPSLVSAIGCCQRLSRLHHASEFTVSKNRCNFTESRLPSVRTPEQRSNPNGPTSSIAWRTFCEDKPPARKRGAWACSRICSLRSEEHTSELQSHDNLVCRLLL